MRENRTDECECGKRKHRLSECCPDCRMLDEQRRESESTSARVARYLCHMDWTRMPDLFDAMGVDDGAEKWCISAAIARLREKGDVERRGERLGGYEYRFINRPKPTLVAPCEPRPPKIVLRGACTECGEPCTLGKPLCDRHRAREYMRRRYLDHVARGLCGSCGKGPPNADRPGSPYCESCFEKMRARRARSKAA